MKFELGKIIDEFELDGKKILFRYPKKNDLDGMLNYINTLVRNREFISRQKPVAREEEAKWLRGVLRDVKKAKKIHIVVEVNGKIVGNGEVKRGSFEADKHTGEIGIGLSKEIQNRGIGTRLLKTLIDQSKLFKLKILILRVFDLNERAKHVYEKTGFKYAGRIPNGVNYYGKYCDSLIYFMEVPK